MKPSVATLPLLKAVAALCVLNTILLAVGAFAFWRMWRMWEMWAMWAPPRGRRSGAAASASAPHASPSEGAGDGGDGGVCSALTCGAVDPVSDPAYNMREIAKQSILLEEHLTVDAKFCVDCVTKHFLHIIGLANEAAMLAGADAARFPLLDATGPTYDRLFERWLATRGGPEALDARLKIAGEMRDFRKKVIAAYWPNAAMTSKA